MAVVNWQNDLIYFDRKPTPVNQWINANELIRASRKNEIYIEDKKTLNLYPILVRRNDFVRHNSKDRILARFPYVLLTKEEISSIEKKQLLIAEKLRDYFYKSDNRKILEWREILAKNLERGALPLPFLRCLPDDLEFSLVDRDFESARGEAFRVPIQLTNEIAYLGGIINGDGNLQKYIVSIVDYSAEHIQILKKSFQNLFNQTGRFHFQSPNCPELLITNLWVVRFFSFLTGHPIGGKKYSALQEPQIFKEEMLRYYYWSGVMDADGSYKGGGITLTTASKKFAADFISFLQDNNMQSILRERKDDSYQVYIRKPYYDIYKEKMYSLHPDKKQYFKLLKKGKSRKSDRSKTQTISKPKVFLKWKQDTQTEGYFDFSLIHDTQVIGLGSFVKEVRGLSSTSSFAEKLGISQRSIYQLENEEHGLTIINLEKILTFTKQPLMDFLFSKGKTIKFRKRSSKPVYLPYRPTKQFLRIVKELTFHKTTIQYPSDNPSFKQELQVFFGIDILYSSIRNRLLHHFFETFCEFK